MNEDQRFYELLGKKFSGEATADELAELEGFLKKYPGANYTAQNLSDIWGLHSLTDTPETEAAFDTHQRLLQGFTPTPSKPFVEPVPLRSRFTKAVRIGLVALIALCITGAIWLVARDKATATARMHPTQLSTAHGNHSQLVLPDSSVVWLNSGSSLTYDKDFGITNRATLLRGEAFFEVRKGKLPFTVQAQAAQIKVMGTAFNVKAYDGEPFETSLIHGKVEVTLDKRPGEPFYLKPNEKLVVAPANETLSTSRKKGPLVVLKEVTPVNDGAALLETSWVDNKLYFHEESFAEVARKMERWYNVQIEISDSRLANLQVGGGPFENETVEQALQALQIAFDFRFTIKGSRITITR